jgi:hypothetical protein
MLDFNELKQQHTNDPIDTEKIRNVLFDFILQATENIKNPDLFAQAMLPDIYRKADLNKALFLSLADFNKVADISYDKLHPDQEDAIGRLGRDGYYHPLYDSIHVEPFIYGSRPTTYKNMSKDTHAADILYKKMLSILRHELSHRQQQYESYDKKPATIVEANESERYDPDHLLTSSLDSNKWTNQPIEWTAVADEVGYMLHMLKPNLNISSDKAIEDALYNKHYNFTRITDLLSTLILSNNKYISLAASNAYNVWLNRIRESFERGNVKISDERVKTRKLVTRLAECL